MSVAGENQGIAPEILSQSRMRSCSCSVSTGSPFENQRRSQKASFSRVSNIVVTVLFDTRKWTSTVNFACMSRHASIFKRGSLKISWQTSAPALPAISDSASNGSDGRGENIGLVAANEMAPGELIVAVIVINKNVFKNIFFKRRTDDDETEM